MRTVNRSVLIVGVAMLYAGTAAAVSAEDWGVQFGPVGGGPAASGSGAGYDHSFIREWQANPPKGYATVSAANIAATKAAIARYDGIVQRGGFAPVPEWKWSRASPMLPWPLCASGSWHQAISRMIRASRTTSAPSSKPE